MSITFVIRFSIVFILLVSNTFFFWGCISRFRSSDLNVSYRRDRVSFNLCTYVQALAQQLIMSTVEIFGTK